MKTSNLILFGFALVLAMAIPRLASAKEVRRYALIVGVNQAPVESHMQALQYADDDAARHFELFERVVVKTELLTVLDIETQQRFPGLAKRTSEPTREAFASTLANLFSDIASAKEQGFETEFYFLYSGHGVLLSGQEGAIMLQDGQLKRSDLYEMLIEKSPADFNHLIIDACNAYFMVHRRGEDGDWRDDSSGRQRAEVQAFFEDQDISRHPNTGMVLSTTTEAETHEWARYQGGIFSHEIRSGMLGAADITEDGLVEYSEIQAFIKAANHRVDDPKAKLKVYVRPPAKDRNRPLFDLLALNSVTYLDIPASISGRFYLENDRGIRYADFNKSNEQLLSIALLPARSYYLRDEGRAKEYEIDLEGQARVPFTALIGHPMQLAAKGAVDQTFRANLFTQPYGRNYYEGMAEGLGMVRARRVARVDWSPVEPESDLMIRQKSPTTQWRKPVAWASLVLGVGSLAGAGTLTWFATDSADKYRNSMTHEDAYLRDRDTYTYSAIGMYAAGAAFVGLSIYCFVTMDQDSGGQVTDGAVVGSKSSWQPLAGFGPEGAFVGVRSDF